MLLKFRIDQVILCDAYEWQQFSLYHHTPLIENHRQPLIGPVQNSGETNLYLRQEKVFLFPVNKSWW